MDIRAAGAVLGVLLTIYASRAAWAYHLEEENRIELEKQEEMRRAQNQQQQEQQEQQQPWFQKWFGFSRDTSSKAKSGAQTTTMAENGQKNNV